MNIRRASIGAGVGLILCAITAASGGPAAATSRCSMGAPLGAIARSTYLILAHPIADSALAPMDDSTWARLERPGLLRPVGTWAQRFVVKSIALPEAAMWPLAVGDTFAVTPWAYVADCSTIPWQSSAVWVQGESEVVFRISSPRSRAASPAYPAFDVLGWHAPYPAGAFLRTGRPGDATRDGWMPASIYFDFVSALPRLGGGESVIRQPPEVRSAIDEWVRKNPQFANTLPSPRLR